MPDQTFIRNFRPFYNILGKERNPLVFCGESKNSFLEHVLPKISETMVLDIPEELESRYITCDLEAKLLIDKFKTGIRAELKYKYGDYEFNSFENAPTGSYIVVRQREKEEEIMSELLKKGFVPYKNFYLLKSEEKVYDFLSVESWIWNRKQHYFILKISAN